MFKKNSFLIVIIPLLVCSTTSARIGIETSERKKLPEIRVEIAKFEKSEKARGEEKPGAEKKDLSGNSYGLVQDIGFLVDGALTQSFVWLVFPKFKSHAEVVRGFGVPFVLVSPKGENDIFFYVSFSNPLLKRGGEKNR